jgi:hypothetical protein
MGAQRDVILHQPVGELEQMEGLHNHESKMAASATAIRDNVNQ